VWALSALPSYLQHWLCYLGNTRVTTAPSWRQSVFLSFHSVGFHSPIIYSSFVFQNFLSTFFHHSITILQLNFQLSSKSTSKFWWWRKPQCAEDTTGMWSRWKSLLYHATYLVPQAGIEPTPCIDTGYGPWVRCVRCADLLGQRVPPIKPETFTTYIWHQSRQLSPNAEHYPLYIWLKKKKEKKSKT
jgi:hypothetical protein